MSEFAVRPFNTSYIADGRIKHSEAWVVLGPDGKVVGGPVETQEEAEAKAASCEHEAEVSAYLEEAYPDASPKSRKSKANVILAYLEHCAQPAKDVEKGAEEPEETKPGTPGKDEPTLDDKEEF